MKFILAAFIGLASVNAINKHNQQKLYENMNVQLSDDVTHGGNEYYSAGDQGMTPNGVEYVRTMPEQFNEDSDNKFMRKIIDEYALEQKTDKGQPSGIFKMDKKQTLNASKWLIAKVKKLEGKDKELDNYMKQYFQRTWEHFDVNEEGVLDALDMPAFMKYIASDQGIDLDSLA